MNERKRTEQEVMRALVADGHSQNDARVFLAASAFIEACGNDVEFADSLLETLADALSDGCDLDIVLDSVRLTARDMKRAPAAVLPPGYKRIEHPDAATGYAAIEAATRACKDFLDACSKEADGNLVALARAALSAYGEAIQDVSAFVEGPPQGDPN